MEAFDRTHTNSCSLLAILFCTVSERKRTIGRKSRYFHTPFYIVSKQEAHLSQRNRATLRVIEYLAKSLKIIQGHSK